MKDKIITFILTIAGGIGILLAIYLIFLLFSLIYSENIISKKKIQLLQKIMPAEDYSFLQQFCGDDYSCWEKERALQSGIVIKKERHGKVYEDAWYKNGVKVN